jgi:hypothetical protein
MGIEISEFDPDKIGAFPQDIEKLIWRALFYKSQIKILEQEFTKRGDLHTFEKLEEYRKAFQNTCKIINNQCKRKGLETVTIVD